MTCNACQTNTYSSGGTQACTSCLSIGVTACSSTTSFPTACDTFYSLSTTSPPQCISTVYDSCAAYTFSASWNGPWLGTSIYATTNECMQYCLKHPPCMAFKSPLDTTCYVATTFGTAIVPSSSNDNVAFLR